MLQWRIISSSMVGTTSMTVFSYWVSVSENKKFREPVVLGQLLNRLSRNISYPTALKIGWLLHYAVGALFVRFYHILWKRKKIKPSVLTGSYIGLASGIVGVVVWKTVFIVHPNPPQKKLLNFFGHLMLAHVVFGIFCSLAYKKIKMEKGI